MGRHKIGLAIIGLIFVAPALLAGCGQKPASGNSAPASAKWINAGTNGDTVSVNLAEVQRNRMSNFKVNTDAGSISFMAYVFEDKVQVRADICPPCRSNSFTLYPKTLVCDTCGTIFDARNGNGISGGCVAFPKAAVNYEVSQGKMTMKLAELATAYQSTLKPGWP